MNEKNDLTEQGLALGIDLGTTSVKVSMVNISTKQSVFTTSEQTQATTDSSAGENGAEQDVSKILTAVYQCIMRITNKNRSLIKCIGVSGQMHGVMLWKNEPQVQIHGNSIAAVDTSNLYTWQDQRADKDFLAHLPKPDSHQCLATGFGSVTLFWLCHYKPEVLVKYNVAGSVVDYLVTLLCGLDSSMMTDHLAASWGYFNCELRNWNTDILKERGFPVHLLPVVVQPGTFAGGLAIDWLGIPQGTPVLAGLGDLQCAFASATNNKTDAVLNLSTSCQLTYPVACSNFTPPRHPTPQPISYFPFFDKTYLAVAASLNGGNVLASFVTMVQQWLAVFGLNIDTDSVWSKLTEISANDGVPFDSGASILPAIFGERHNPQMTASASGFTAHNTALHSVYRSVCEGLISNIHHMLPCPVLIESGIKRLIMCGSVVERQPIIRESVRYLYGHIEIIQGSSADSALGAALIAARYLDRKG